MITRDPANFREYAGTLACLTLVLSAIVLIFLYVLVPIYTEKPVALPDAVQQFFFGLVMAGIGYLIGKQTAGPNGPTVNVPVTETSTTTVETTP